MAKKKHQPYKHLPLYIVIKPNGRPFNSHTGLFLSDKEIEAYTSHKEFKTKEHKQQEHWINKYYGNG